MNALANEEVGKYVTKYFCSAFQRVGTFRIVGPGKQKQGGNVATYFCAPDGRVLHAIAGPVNAQTFLREAKWVVETTEKAMKATKDMGDRAGAEFKATFRKAHAEKLRTENGLVVEPVTTDVVVEQDPKSALTYRDPSGRPLAPILPPPPIEGPDVKLRYLQEAAKSAPNATLALDRRGGRWVLGNNGRVSMLLAGHCMAPIEKLYGAVFEGILGEKITTRPVEVVNNGTVRLGKIAITR